MRKLYLILILTSILGCSQKQNDIRISGFEKTLGENETKALNSLVSDFENNLDKIYPELPKNEAYKKYLTDIISDSTLNGEKFEFLSQQTRSEFHNSGLWNEVYTRDSINGLTINRIGKYLQALYEVRDSDSLIRKYWDNREAAGILQNELFVNGIISSNPDFENYFHKRIVVMEFSF